MTGNEYGHISDRKAGNSEIPLHLRLVVDGDLVAFGVSSGDDFLLLTRAPAVRGAGRLALEHCNGQRVALVVDKAVDVGALPRPAVGLEHSGGGLDAEASPACEFLRDGLLEHGAEVGGLRRLDVVGRGRGGLVLPNIEGCAPLAQPQDRGDI